MALKRQIAEFWFLYFLPIYLKYFGMLKRKNAPTEMFFSLKAYPVVPDA